MSGEAKKVGVLTSGGDAPGMNAAIRAVVRGSLAASLQPVGIYRGYQGILEKDFRDLAARSVSNIIQRGGTILKTSRSEEFKTEGGLRKAASNLNEAGIGSLVVIGGDGSLRGAERLGQFWKGQLIGLPGTIDNDLFGTDLTIGYDTALTTAVEGIDKIRDTAESHDRFFLVEVMGRHSGFIALEAAVAGGAEEVLLPETDENLEEVASRLAAGQKRGKTSSIIVVAEGEEHGGAFAIAEKLKTLTGCENRVVVLGYLQRGGSPTVRDRVLASELGLFAVDQIREGRSGVMVGKIRDELTCTPFAEAYGKKKRIDPRLVRVIDTLSQ